ncbi:hypothetical protein ACFLSJ_06225, partial [Verrucomicrobiota bacterium]
ETLASAGFRAAVFLGVLSALLNSPIEAKAVVPARPGDGEESADLAARLLPVLRTPPETRRGGWNELLARVEKGCAVSHHFNRGPFTKAVWALVALLYALQWLMGGWVASSAGAGFGSTPVAPPVLTVVAMSIVFAAALWWLLKRIDDLAEMNTALYWGVASSFLVLVAGLTSLPVWLLQDPGPVQAVGVSPVYRWLPVKDTMVLLFVAAILVVVPRIQLRAADVAKAVGMEANASLVLRGCPPPGCDVPRLPLTPSAPGHVRFVVLSAVVIVTHNFLDWLILPTQGFNATSVPPYLVIRALLYLALAALSYTSIWRQQL